MKLNTRHFMTLSVYLLTFLSISALGAPIVSKESLKRQRSLTKFLWLKSGTPLTVRQVESSDILVMSLFIQNGTRNLPYEKRAVNDFALNALPFGGKKFPKNKMDEVIANESISVDCDGGIEISGCHVVGLTEQLSLVTEILADIVLTPEFNKISVENLRSRLVSKQLATAQNPDQMVNEIVNQVYYPRNHPYRLDFTDAAEQLKSITLEELKDYHSRLIAESPMNIVVVTNLSPEKITKQLEKHLILPKRKSKISPIVSVQDPSYDKNFVFKIVDRDIPTAYMRAKFPVPGQGHPDAIATRLTFDIISEDLMEEIRTKRSLSYSVFASPIQHSIGIGVLSASTPKLKETIEAMALVLDRTVRKKFSIQELEEYKTGMLTTYLQSLETHQSLASALGGHVCYHGSPFNLYEFPQKLDSVKPEDINRIARSYLKNMRVGVLFKEKEFQKDWLEPLLNRH